MKDDALLVELRRIGLARFYGRLRAGLIDREAGHRAIEALALEERRAEVKRRWCFLLKVVLVAGGTLFVLVAL